MNIQESVKNFENYLEMERTPVGVKFFFDKESFLKFDAPIRENKLTYCNSVKLASIGHKMKLTKAHQACPNGAFALNFVDVPEPIKNGKGRFSKCIYQTQDISKSINDDMTFMPKRPFGYAMMPLKEFHEDPDVVLVISGPYNIMRMIQGHAYFSGYTNNLKTCGLQAVCQDITTYPYVTGDINITLLCPGTRLVASWKPNEMAMGIPFSKWYDLVDGVIATTNPFARNPLKKSIKRKLRKNGEDDSDVILYQNYDDGSYKGGKVDLGSLFTEDELKTQTIGSDSI